MESSLRSSKRRRRHDSHSAVSPSSSSHESDQLEHPAPSPRLSHPSRQAARSPSHYPSSTLYNVSGLRGSSAAPSPASSSTAAGPTSATNTYDAIAAASSPSATARPYSSTSSSRYASHPAYSSYSGISHSSSHALATSRHHEANHPSYNLLQHRNNVASPRDHVDSGAHTPEVSSSTRYNQSPDSPQPPPAFEPDSSASMLSSAPIPKSEQGTPSDKPRGGQACLECRLAKVRCLPSSESDNCQRCHRFNFECLFVQHKRGRKPKSKLQGRDLTLLAEAASATPASAIIRQTPTHPGIVSTSSDLGAVRKSSVSLGATSDASPGVRWGSTAHRSFPLSAEESAIMDMDTSLTAQGSPRSGSPKRQTHTSTRGPADGFDPKNLYGVDVGRMTRAMQQAMRSLERRRGAPYTLVTNNDVSEDANEDDGASDADLDASTPLPAPGTTAPNDTNAANESFELIAEQPLTLRVMLKPFEVADDQDCDAPRVVQDDRITVGAPLRELVMDDPVTTGVLTEAAARALFDLFMVHCNAWSEIFDPALHSHEFLRKRSSFLYTVLLYVGSRYSRTPTAQHLVAREQRGERVEQSEWNLAYADQNSERTQHAADEYARQIRRQLHAQARDHAARAFVDGDRTVLCCQAFFILASWKPLDDGLSVIQVGYAFRLAMDIQLHAEMPNCVKPTESLLDQAGRQRYEAVQRRFRNRQRTFLMLFVQDKSQQIANKISTHSISADNVLIRRCQTWWKLQGAIPSDAFVCASADLRRIQAKYVELYDRIEALTSSTSDGPSVMMPAFLNDLVEWSARWHDALGLKEDSEEVPNMDDPELYRSHCQCLCLKLWKNNIKTYISSWVLKSSLKQAAVQEHQEAVRNHHRRSTTRGTEDKDSFSGKSHSGLEPGTVNLMAMPAFWPCVEGARGVLEAVCAFPPQRLLTAPDATVMQTTHAAVLLCSLATVKSQPPLGPGYLRSNIQLIDQTSAAFRRASITEDDTVLHIALYLESLLRPRNTVPGSTPSQPRSDESTNAGRGTSSHTQLPDFSARRQPDTRSVSTRYAEMANNNNSGGAAAPFTGNFNGSDQFYVGGSSKLLPTNGENGLEGGGGVGSMFDEDGLNAIAAAATAAAGNASNHPAMDISSVTWPTPTQAASSGNGAGPWNSNNHTPWTSFMFNPLPTNPPLHAQQQQQQQQQQQAQAADETLQMLLRFLDG